MRNTDTVPIKIILYSTSPGTDLCLTLESLLDTNRRCPYEIHLIFDWDREEPSPTGIPCERLDVFTCTLHRNPDLKGFYPNVHAIVQALRAQGPAHFCILRQGAILSPGVLDSLCHAIEKQGYGAVSPITPYLTGCAIPLAAGAIPTTMNAKLRLAFGPETIPAPLLDLDVFILSQEALDHIPAPQLRLDQTHHSLVRCLRTLDEAGFPLGIRLDAYAYRLPTVLHPRPGVTLHGAGRTRRDGLAMAAAPRSIADMVDLVEAPRRAALTQQLRAFADRIAPRLARFFDLHPIITAEETVCVLISSLDLYGGVLVLVDWINRLILNNVDVRVYVQHRHNPPDPGLHLLFAPKPFTDLDTMAGELPVGTRVIATFWTTAKPAHELVWRIPRARGYYFIQDYEVRFYSDDAHEGDHRRGAAASYTLPLTQIVTSRWIAEQLVPEDPMGTAAIPRIPVGIDLAIFPPTPRASFEVQSPVLIAMARPETPRRGYALLIDALGLIHRRHPLIRIRLFGSDRLFETELPFPCDRLGKVGPDQLRALYREADFLVETSEFQGFGLVPLEAMALGCACVLTASGGIDEYARDRVNALVVAHDTQAIADAVSDLIEKPALREAISTAAVATARLFGRARTAEEWLRRFREDEERRAGPDNHARGDSGIVVIVPIYNQLQAARRCIESILPTLADKHRLLLIDDRSDAHTAAELSAFADTHSRVTYLRNDLNLGFVGAANRGMSWAGIRGQDMILLNSDTLVVTGWLDRIQRAAESDPTIGILSPLANTSPHLHLHPPPGQTFLTADLWLQETVKPLYPTVITPEGWCFYIRHQVWRRLGGFDPIFGRGYCEESDYCLRALAAGWRLACCDNLMIYHQGQVTFGGQRSQRYLTNRRIFDQRWSMIYERIYPEFLKADPLGIIRSCYHHEFGLPQAPSRAGSVPFNLLKILDTPGLEDELSAYERGFSRRQAVALPSRPTLVLVLPDLRPQSGLHALVMMVNTWILQGRNIKVVVLDRANAAADQLGLLVTPLFLAPDHDFPDAFPPADLVIGTLWLTLYPIVRVALRRPTLQVGHYIHDYEPDLPDVMARGLQPYVMRVYPWSTLAFTHDDGIRERLSHTHGNLVLLPPMLDLDRFYPKKRGNRSNGPATPPRPVVAARLDPVAWPADTLTLLAVLGQLREDMPDLDIQTFGCAASALPPSARKMIDQHHGPLLHAHLPDFHARVDIFLDTSASPGNGQIIAEAMACEVACVITASDGSPSFAHPEENCLVAPPGDVETLVAQTLRLLQDPALRERLAKAGRSAVASFSPRLSAELAWRAVASLSIPREPGPQALSPPPPRQADGTRDAAANLEPAADTPELRCNLCGHSRFTPDGERPEWICTHCGSRDRTRLLWLFLNRLELSPHTRILHLAPEKGIYDALIRRVGLPNYETADIDPKRYPFAANIRRLDLCHLEALPSDHYDLILHSHVLEHTPCDIAYTLRHLHRALAPHGIHLCIIPFLSGCWDESFEDIGDAERERRFGQFDHVRRFGRDNIERHLGAILDLDTHFDATRTFTPEVLRSCNIHEIVWRGLTPETVLTLKKADLKASQATEPARPALD